MPIPQTRDSEHIFISKFRVTIWIEQEREEYCQVYSHRYWGYSTLGHSDRRLLNMSYGVVSPSPLSISLLRVNGELDFFSYCLLESHLVRRQAISAFSTSYVEFR